jgi:hypothetical protein
VPFKPLIPYESNGSSRLICEHLNGKDYGYALITVDGENATVEWKAWDGSGKPKWPAEDRFSLRAKNAGIAGLKRMNMEK